VNQFVFAVHQHDSLQISYAWQALGLVVIFAGNTVRQVLISGWNNYSLAITRDKVTFSPPFLPQYSIQASFLEIYNETIRDLLTSNAKSTLTHDIKLDSSVPGGVYVTNIDPISVTTESQVATLLQRANRNRAVAATNCNERSSRSHSVFRLQLTGHNEITSEKCKGILGWHITYWWVWSIFLQLA
jgi:hypothetical protein